MKLESSSFADGERLPPRHAAESQNRSPSLSWTGAPEGTRSYTLLCVDPDAPGGEFTHWVLYDLPGDAEGLPEAFPRAAKLPSGAKQGENDFGRLGWDGPAPPAGPAHRYRFTLYALRGPSGLAPGADRGRVEAAAKARALAAATLTGLFERPAAAKNKLLRRR